jgi:hypothetical protein
MVTIVNNSKIYVYTPDDNCCGSDMVESGREDHVGIEIRLMFYVNVFSTVLFRVSFFGTYVKFQYGSSVMTLIITGVKEQVVTVM